MKFIICILSLLPFCCSAQVGITYHPQQQLSISNDTLWLSHGGGFVVLPSTEHYQDFYATYTGDTLEIASNGGYLPKELDNLEVKVNGNDWTRNYDFQVDTIASPDRLIFWRPLEGEKLKIKFFTKQ